jgi:hypothetical protein
MYDDNDDNDDNMEFETSFLHRTFLDAAKERTSMWSMELDEVDKDRIMEPLRPCIDLHRKYHQCPDKKSSYCYDLFMGFLMCAADKLEPERFAAIEEKMLKYEGDAKEFMEASLELHSIV